MADQNGKKLATVPYVAWKTFISTLDSLANFMPDKIDTSIWGNFSGGVRSQLLSTYKFLGLITDDGTPTAELRKLADDKPGRPELLRAVLRKGYGDLMKLDLAKATPNSFDAEMRKYGQEGETHRKAQGFFLLAAKYAGVPLSPLLLKRGSLIAMKPRRRQEKPESNGSVAAAAAGAATNNGAGAPATNARSFNLPGGTVLTIGTDRDAMRMNSEDRKIVFGLLDDMEKYGAEEEEEIDVEEELES
jgi:hypothetical protein